MKTSGFLSGCAVIVSMMVMVYAVFYAGNDPVKRAVSMGMLWMCGALFVIARTTESS